MANGNKENSPSQSIKGRLQEGVQESVFRQKELLDPKTVIDEDRIIGRNSQLGDIIGYLQPVLQNNRPSNMLLYGPSGTGKSLIINAVCQQVVETATAQGTKFGVVEINCQMIKSHDRAVYCLAASAAAEAGVEVGVPETGVSTGTKLNRFYEIVSQNFDCVLVILDEIDLLDGHRRGADAQPAHSKLLYQLSRATQLAELSGTVSVAALTNDPQFMNELDGRAESSFNPEGVVFSDYDADQLRAILKNRRDAYREEVLADAIIPLSAALAAKDHGDARKAIDLLRKAGEIADRNDERTVKEKHVKAAQTEAERDRTLTQMQGLSAHKKLSLYATAIIAVHSDRSLDAVPSTIAYNIYKFLTNTLDYDEKSRDSYLRYMKEAETYNFVNSVNTGRGYRGGVHKEYTFTHNPRVVADTLESDFSTEELENEAAQLKSVVNAQVDDFFDED